MFNSSPTAASIINMLELPYETNGSGTPVRGARPRTAKRLIVA